MMLSPPLVVLLVVLLPPSAFAMLIAKATVPLSGMASVPRIYDAYVIDQWGVMHDGLKPYPGAVECIRDIHESGAKIVLLSNSSKRSSNGLKNLERMGFDSKHFVDVVTSGELAWRTLKERRGFAAAWGRKVFVIGSGDGDLEYITTAGLEPSSPDACDFVLARGMFSILEKRTEARDGEGAWEAVRLESNACTSEEVQRALALCASRGKPLLVTNPDYIRPGTNDPMPGLLGESYSQQGGTVHYVGKPHEAVYEECYRVLAEAGCRRPSEGGKLCAVGDSLSHDILGASCANMDSVFIASGVHSEELGLIQGGAPDSPPPAEEELVKLFARLGDKHDSFRPPTYTILGFRN